MTNHKQTGDGNLDASIESWLRQAGFSENYTLRPLSGGDINEVALLKTADGQQFCLKTNRKAPADFFRAESCGLEAIASTDSIRVPEVLLTGGEYILLEYIEPARRQNRYWQTLGQGLARLHSTSVDGFGFTMDNYCGLTPQPNPRYEDGHAFFREQRLMYQAKLAFDAGLLGKSEIALLEAVASKLVDLIPVQSPALIHGDLWSGNIHNDEAGKPVLIDPAAHWGWPEADIAMTLLFGGFAEDFYAAYLSLRPLEPGWRDRMPIYNLYHLLNHLNLFGGSYLSQVLSVARRFA